MRKNRFTKEETEKLINEVFDHHGNPISITEDQFEEYFKEKKGLCDDDILIPKARGMLGPRPHKHRNRIN